MVQVDPIADVVLFNVSNSIAGIIEPGIEKLFDQKPCRVLRPGTETANMVIHKRSDIRRYCTVVFVDSAESYARAYPDWYVYQLKSYLFQQITLRNKHIIFVLADNNKVCRLSQELKKATFECDTIERPKTGAKAEDFVDALEQKWNEFLNEPEIKAEKNRKISDFWQGFMG